MFRKVLLSGLDAGMDLKPVVRTASNGQSQLSTFPFFLPPLHPATGHAVWNSILGGTNR